jgi:hypothetical protein
MHTKYLPTERAAKYLKRIATLTGAEQVYGDRYSLEAGRRHFLVDSKIRASYLIPRQIDVLFCCGGPGPAERGNGCVCITTIEEQSETV